MNFAVTAARRLMDDDARFRLHNRLCGYGWSMRLYGLVQPKLRGLRVDDATDLVLEGFPRSANTYALAAFRCANGQGFTVADHLHSSRSVKVGVERGLPVVVLVRDPVDACASLIQRQKVRPEIALATYCQFYEAIEPLLDHVVVSDFSVTVRNFGTAITALNARFGTSFRPYLPTSENEAWCRDFILSADRADQGGYNSKTVALPEPSRRSRRPEIIASLTEHEDLVKRARTCYCIVAQKSAR